MVQRACFVLVVALVAACGDGLDRSGRAEAGRPFQLHAGQAAVLGEDLRVRFERVRYDSRCPVDAQCAKAGNAVVVLAFSRPDEAPTNMELTVVGKVGQAPVTHLNYSVEVTSLTPEPRTDRRIQPGDYVATLIASTR